MTPGRSTELFSLDEATALAAGRRPCAECQRARYLLFREMWAAANPELIGGPMPSADEIDSVLHAERLDGERAKRTYLSPVSALPPGVMVAGSDGLPYLVQERWLAQWAPAGYGRRIPKPDGVIFRVLTPRSIVRAIRQGYPSIFSRTCSNQA